MWTIAVYHPALFQTPCYLQKVCAKFEILITMMSLSELSTVDAVLKYQAVKQLIVGVNSGLLNFYLYTLRQFGASRVVESCLIGVAQLV